MATLSLLAIRDLVTLLVMAPLSLLLAIRDLVVILIVLVNAQIELQRLVGLFIVTTVDFISKVYTLVMATLSLLTIGDLVIILIDAEINALFRLIIATLLAIRDFVVILIVLVDV
ncbi:hypothetical protein GGR51DRAFT_543736 [Nemania sp. FL0031]|nr:hypothetical protein GGR51DRAFT_543736 [Nemania sp. FL0031]